MSVGLPWLTSGRHHAFMTRSLASGRSNARHGSVATDQPGTVVLGRQPGETDPAPEPEPVPTGQGKAPKPDGA